MYRGTYLTFGYIATENGIIEKVQKGIYISSDMIEDEFYIFQMKNSNAIFSYNTAMYFLGETERTPNILSNI